MFYIYFFIYCSDGHDFVMSVSNYSLYFYACITHFKHLVFFVSIFGKYSKVCIPFRVNVVLKGYYMMFNDKRNWFWYITMFVFTFLIGQQFIWEYIKNIIKWNGGPLDCNSPEARKECLNAIVNECFLSEKVCKEKVLTNILWKANLTPRWFCFKSEMFDVIPYKKLFYYKTKITVGRGIIRSKDSWSLSSFLT